MTRLIDAHGDNTATGGEAHPIGVFNEWGRLREVLVGNIAHDVVPKWSPDWGHSHGFRDASLSVNCAPAQGHSMSSIAGLRAEPINNRQEEPP